MSRKIEFFFILLIMRKVKSRLGSKKTIQNDNDINLKQIKQFVMPFGCSKTKMQVQKN